MSGFQAPNYTQVPNDFFEMAQTMGEAELKVVLCIMRETFGYHREECQLSIRKLAVGSGLTPRNAYNGAEKAIARGIIEKTVSPTNTTIWRAVVAGDTVRVRRGYSAVSPGKGKAPVKESKEIIKENEDDALATIAAAYTAEIGMLTPMIADELREASTTYPLQWIMDAIKESATQNKRGWKYILAILTRWKAQGNQEQMKPQQQNKNFKPRDLIQERYGGIMEWAQEMQNNDNVSGNDSNNGAISSSVPQLKA